MPKLTDTQLVILSAAARRRDRAVLPLPKSLKVKGGAATKTLEGLCKKGLLEEKPAARNAAASARAAMSRAAPCSRCEASAESPAAISPD